MKKNITAGALLLCLSHGAVAGLFDESEIRIGFNYDLDAGDYPCYIENVARFDHEPIVAVGLYEAHDTVTIICEEPSNRFQVFFEPSPTTTGSRGDVYSDAFVEVFVGSPTSTASGGALYMRGTYSNSYEFGHSCSEPTASNWHTPSVSVGTESLYPIGGVEGTTPSNRNLCVNMRSTTEDGRYDIDLVSYVLVNELPEGDALDDIITDFSIPMVLRPMVATGGDL